MFAKVASYCRKYDLLRAGDRVVVGVSGGADSVCLLHVLVRLRAKLGLTVHAVHVHHGLRGDEADRDAAFVKKLAEEWEVPYREVRVDVRGYAAQNSLSEEEAGRILRYRALSEEAERLAANGNGAGPGGARIPDAEREDGNRRVRIAVGHQKEDQAETILHHLFRGSALKGLAGMAPSVEPDSGAFCLIRPLLGVSRGEIRAYLAENGLTFCEDSTNDTADYTRNRIRQLLPQICTEVNARAVDHILAAGARIAQADVYFENEAARIWKESGVLQAYRCALAPADAERYGAETGGEVRRFGIPAAVLGGLPEILAGYLAMKMITRMTGSAKDITSVHAEQLCALARMETGKQVSLPYGLRAVREYEMIWVEQTMPGRTGEQAAAVPDADPARALTFSRFPREKNGKIPENRYTKWFDYDKIKGVLSVRTRQSGDYITLKDGHRKSVKSYMIDEKIPRGERERILMLAEGSHVLWIVGYRISEYYKVTEATKEILQAQAYGGESDVREDKGTDPGRRCE